MEKIYARQSDPAEQDSGLWEDDEGRWYEDIIVDGNAELTPYVSYELRDIWREVSFLTPDREAIVSMLTNRTGCEWGCVEIHGGAQREWNVCYYMKHAIEGYDRDVISRFECDYFNTGTEWLVSEYDYDEELPPDDPEDLDRDPNFVIYCSSSNTDDIRREIADAFGKGATADDVVLYAFDGYECVPKYREIGMPRHFQNSYAAILRNET